MTNKPSTGEERMSDDLVKRLVEDDDLHSRIEAADRIKALEDALRPFADLATEIEQLAATMPEGDPARSPEGWSKSCTWEDLRRARQTLGGNGEH